MATISGVDMMNNTLVIVGTTCFLAIGGFFAGIGGTDVVTDLVSPPKPYGLVAAELRYENGMFIQRISPINAKIVPAQWTGEINRNGSQLCGGSGNANYEGVEQRYSPNDWTGDNCPELNSGDVALGTWKYEDVHGNNIIISREVAIR